MKRRVLIKYVISVLLILFIGSGVTIAQDPQFSQYYAAPIYLGPSFAGSTGEAVAGMNFRAQWMQLPRPFLSTFIYADKYIEKYKLGTGFTIMHDDAAGLINSLFLGTQYSYRINLNSNNFFVPGIQVQYFTKRINDGDLVFSDQIYNGSILPVTTDSYDSERYHHADFALSGLFFGDKYWAGVTGRHLMRLNNYLPQSQEYSSFWFSAYGGYKFDIMANTGIRNIEKSITVSFNFKRQERIQQLDIGFYHLYSPFMIGLWYRGIPFVSNGYSRDALTLLAGYQTSGISFAYSYDMTLSRLINSTGGSHEISVSYKFSDPKNRRKKIRAVPCPRL